MMGKGDEKIVVLLTVLLVVLTFILAANGSNIHAGSTGAVVAEQSDGEISLGIFDAEANSSSCGRVSSSLTLTNNVTNASTCFTINASNLILDCVGYTITYGETASGYGINNSGGYDNITVKNCIITKGSATGSANYGVYLSNSTVNSTILNNTIFTNGTANNYGIFLSSSGDNILHSNNISGVNVTYMIFVDNASANNTLIYNNSFGQINWTSTNLTTNITLQLGNTIFIENNTIGLTDNTQALNLNGTANGTIIITFYGLNLTNHTIRKNGVRCDNNTALCNITSADNTATLVAQVSGFSNYTIQDLSCGDKSCNFGENCTSCASDCGSYNCSSPIDCTRLQLANGTYVEFNRFISGGDGIVILDRDSDGIVAAADLFGERNLTGRDVDNGFEDLALLDTNGDGIINTSDTNYTNLKIWRRNTSSLELVNLNQTNVTVINLAYRDEVHPIITQLGTYLSSTLSGEQIAWGANFSTTSYGTNLGDMLILDLDGDGVLMSTTCTQCSTPATINAESPANNAENTTDATPSFVFNVTDNSATTNCTLWINISGTSTAYDNNNSVKNATATTLTANATLSNADYYWWVNCSDDSGAYITTSASTQMNISISVPAAETTTTSSSSSSSSGGGVNVVEQITGQFAKAVWPVLSQGQEVSLQVENGEIGITAITLEMMKTAYGSWVKVEKVDSAAVPLLGSYKYVKITSNLDQPATIKFKVEKSWLILQGLISKQVSLYRYAQEWTKLDSAIIQEDETYVYYSAETPGFSYFAIGKNNIAAHEEVPVQEEAGQASPADEEVSVQEPIAKEKDYPWLWAIAGIVGIVSLSFLLYYLYRKNSRADQNWK